MRLRLNIKNLMNSSKTFFRYLMIPKKLKILTSNLIKQMLIIFIQLNRIIKKLTFQKKILKKNQMKNSQKIKKIIQMIKKLLKLKLNYLRNRRKKLIILMTLRPLIKPKIILTILIMN